MAVALIYLTRTSMGQAHCNTSVIIAIDSVAHLKKKSVKYILQCKISAIFFDSPAADLVADPR